MKETLLSLLNSRKFWTGAISLVAVAASVLLVTLKLIPESALIPTISAITATALGFMASTAYEDGKVLPATVAPTPPSNQP